MILYRLNVISVQGKKTAVSEYVWVFWKQTHKQLQPHSGQQREAWVPVLEHVGDGFEAARCHPPGTRVAAVHGPVHQVALIWVQLQQQRDCLTAQLVNLGKREDQGEGSQQTGRTLKDPASIHRMPSHNPISFRSANSQFTHREGR